MIDVGRNGYTLTSASDGVFFDIDGNGLNEQDLIDHKGEGAGMQPREIPEALVLPVPLFGGRMEFVGGSDLYGGEAFRRG